MLTQGTQGDQVHLRAILLYMQNQALEGFILIEQRNT